jgi:hypothetical protein
MRLRSIGDLQLVDRPLIVEITRQERVLPGQGCLVERVLRLGPLGRELFTALRERGDVVFDFLRHGPVEWHFHVTVALAQD